MTSAPIILWYRQDLRIRDHRALTAAVQAGAPIIPVYILDDESAGGWRMGGASRWWLHHSIEELQASLKALGSKLVLRRGNTLDVMGNLIRETGARVIHCTRCYEPWASTLERRLNEHLAGDGVVLKRYGGRLLYEPEVLKTHHGEHFKVFSPFWRAMLSLDPPRLPIPPPQAMQAPSRWPVSERLSSWHLLPKKPDWAGGLTDILGARRGRRAEAAQHLSRNRARRLCGRPRPARSSKHLAIIAPHPFRRAEPLPVLACGRSKGGSRAGDRQGRSELPA